MASLSMDMIRSLVGACLRCDIKRETLLLGLPRDLVATFPGGDSLMTQLLHALIELNNLSWQSEAHPYLLEALKTASFLASKRIERQLFDEAIRQLEHGTKSANPDKKQAFFDIATRKMKQAYLNLGCHVTPPLNAPPGPFLAEYPGGRMSVVAVSLLGDGDASSDVEAAIVAVSEWLHLARNVGEDAEGYVVLAPSGRKVERDRVLQAGLRPMDYNQQRGVQVGTIETVVRCHLGERPTALDTSFSVVQGAEAWAADAVIAAFFKEFRSRVLIMVRPRSFDAGAFGDELFRVCASVFLKHGPPAPLPIGTGWHEQGLMECACEVFARYGESVIPIELMPAFREGLICPILVCDSAALSSTKKDLTLLARLSESRSERSKAIVVFSHGDAVAAQRVARSLRRDGWEARLARTV